MYKLHQEHQFTLPLSPAFTQHSVGLLGKNQNGILNSVERYLCTIQNLEDM